MYRGNTLRPPPSTEGEKQLPPLRESGQREMRDLAAVATRKLGEIMT